MNFSTYISLVEMTKEEAMRELELSSNASPDEIKKAYREKAMHTLIR